MKKLLSPRIAIPAGVLLVLLMAGGHFAFFLLQPADPGREKIFTVAPGSGLAQVARQLKAKGVVKNARYFVLLARMQGLTTAVQAGEYLFSAPATPATVLGRLARGDVRQLSLTVPEGLALKEIAVLVEEQGAGKAEEFLRLAFDPAFVSALGIDAASLEGYLFPETYSFAKGTSERQLLRIMVDEMRAHLGDELLARAASMNLSAHELLTLASIIQKEAGRTDEMPIISAVYHNRLKRGMRLQADPTVIYGITDFDGNLTRRHLRERTPYNTYRVAGLPPGPIAGPGQKALDAAVNPADTNALYFVSRGDGSHVFSGNLRQHNKAVRRYQLGR